MVAPGEEKTVLIVDDDPAWSWFVAEDLKARGFRAITVRTVEDALNKLRTEPVGLIILDVLFGEQMAPSGIELAATLSRHEQWCLIPILFLTVLRAEEVQRKLRESRIPASHERLRIMSKPFDFPDFRRNVEELLSIPGPQRRSDKEGD